MDIYKQSKKYKVKSVYQLHETRYVLFRSYWNFLIILKVLILAKVDGAVSEYCASLPHPTPTKFLKIPLLWAF